MIKTIFNFKNKSLEIIDVGESTSGESRQITAFRQYIFNAMRLALQRKIAELQAAGVPETSTQWGSEVGDVFKILPNNNFEWVKAEVENGQVINTYKLKGDEL